MNDYKIQVDDKIIETIINNYKLVNELDETYTKIGTD